jgi:hypothetical protein
MALYSASVLDLETVACFRALQEMRFFPKKMENPPVERLSSTQPAQSTSEKPLTSVDGDFDIFRPKLAVCLTYLKIRLTVVQCTEVGA